MSETAQQTARSLQGYRIELAPTPEQRTRLAQHAGLARVAENFYLEKVRAALAQRAAEQTYGVAEAELTGVPWSAPQLEALWRAAHPDRYPWFTAEGLSSRVPKEAARCRASALKNWVASRAGKRKGRKIGFPAWRKRRDGGRFRYDADRAKPADARTVKLPGIGAVATREDMSWLTGRIAAGTARVLGATIKEQAGRWWISFQLDLDRTALNAARAAPAEADACGLDLGLTVFLTLRNDDGSTEEIHALKPLKRSLRALARANRALARKAEGSANRARQARKVAALHLKVANQRADFLHQTTTWLARTKRAIAVETLNIAGMVKNHRLARAIHDAGWGEFIRQLRYKTDWYGAYLHAADRWFPSSKTCSECKQVHRGLALAERTWTCVGCGTNHDREVNASTNLLDDMLPALEALELKRGQVAA
ncbi:RNA-guided endonuclease InsQ/TnpB family protein [Streptosporangium lutulentum]|uniref:Transposase n=1 Tax=Streptosporangium lutulentum TaxID=1461250 RepID=A0ABT9Q5J7_9ACTN|nr:RNA-guided endonuclease TnpB family protein [Streptosporangium lutulentum]MDP9841942.1 putative transposase [Streptosporangium lutulentum]